MANFGVYIWQKAPFIRLLIPFIAGILLQWHFQFPIFVCWSLLGASAFIFLILHFVSINVRYRLFTITGVSVIFIFVSLGAILTFYKDIRHTKNWFGKSYEPGQLIEVSLSESPVEKTKSFKADASVIQLLSKNGLINAPGNIIIYFQKDPGISKLEYGSTIIFKNTLQEIKNSGNPGGFDYKRYCLFKGLTHQVYLKTGEFIILQTKHRSYLQRFLFSIRDYVTAIMHRYIKGEKELGLAEALLIGYKDDLDKTLVQSYTNTGVVHIIAISGLHLGLIYWLLLLLFKPLRNHKNLNWLHPVLIILFLWLFSLLAGAQASVIRSAVMFTFIIVGENLLRKTSIYNTLAASAFFLLYYNPFWLWDVGFQLSYAAVLSIVLFMHPVYNWLYFKNKAVGFIWKLNSVSIAAQFFTVPISIYHFHQFPNYFLLTNFVAVPLSSLIVLGEILLSCVSFIPIAAGFIGKILSLLIWTMNSYIERIEHLPFSLWDSLQVTITQTILITIFIAAVSYWLMEKKNKIVVIGMISLLGFIIIRSYSIYESNQQKKLIVFNVPRHQAIDFVNGQR
ncbi:MAG: ComEC/Rec2 family competence protein, partial [Bacteroidetes bacterium]|nr:ComEC/Rec2 family competence protein [Bacteroidota bacterium]